MLGWFWKKPKQSLRGLVSLPFTVDDLPHFQAELAKQNDRSCAIVAAALLDRLLVHHLDLVFVDLSDAERDSIFFEANAVLGSFANRTEIAYVLGLITPQERADLARIRRIRNAFAHTLHSIDFSNDVIAAECAKFQTAGPFSLEPNGRSIFTLCLTTLFNQIAARRNGEIVGAIEAMRWRLEEKVASLQKELDETVVRLQKKIFDLEAQLAYKNAATEP
jgi:hypothetical protein